MEGIVTYNWQTNLPTQLSKLHHYLLPSQGLLIDHLILTYGDPIKVKVLFEGLGSSLAGEAEALNISNPISGWLRIVSISSQQKLILYARSFIPLPTEIDIVAFANNQHYFSGIKTLNEQPLGLWLKQRPELKRTPFRFAQTLDQDWDYWPPNNVRSVLRPARQSAFEYQQQSLLLLTEVFC
jgi:chorismate-pyruvate lyase